MNGFNGFGSNGGCGCNSPSNGCGCDWILWLLLILSCCGGCGDCCELILIILILCCCCNKDKCGSGFNACK